MSTPPFIISEQMQEALEAEKSCPTSKPKAIRWTKKSREAAQLYAEGVPIYRICERCKITHGTMEKWIEHPDFKRHAALCGKKISTEMARISIANRVRRLQKMDRRHQLLEQVIEERADAPEMANAPGGKTGLLAHDVKVVGRERVDVFAVDTAMLKEMRELEKQAAIEAGQWNENTTPLLQEEAMRDGFHLTIEDRRTLIIQICAELGTQITAEDLGRIPNLGGHPVLQARTPDDQGRQNA